MARRPSFTPVPMFDLDEFCVERPDSIKRIKLMQQAAADEAADVRIPLDARLHNLNRMRAWVETLLDRITEGDDYAHRPEPWRPG